MEKGGRGKKARDGVSTWGLRFTPAQFIPVVIHVYYLFAAPCNFASLLSRTQRRLAGAWPGVGRFLDCATGRKVNVKFIRSTFIRYEGVVRKRQRHGTLFFFFSGAPTLTYAYRSASRCRDVPHSLFLFSLSSFFFPFLFHFFFFFRESPVESLETLETNLARR